ncbi:2-keto-4-pentenoate hydratase [Massilia niastensis]|uniref:2-keto-4-pentenoate hydratase n=1 Tax=Massilia niastensis TaxID=544911 RepID=UPI00037E27EB|nr:fumarylacetoacetate hydrolase family protein [Massilia niastensis]
MTPDQISLTFRSARAAARPLPAYPGDQVPATLSQAYSIQQASIAAWPDRVAGWKVAAIAPDWREAYPDERLVGPVFSRTLFIATTSAVSAPVIRGGYAAAEAEFAIRISDDFPVDTRFESVSDLLPYVAAVHAAIELAGSPLPNLSALGPGAVISDFGNNTGLIVGPALPDFFARDPAGWLVETDVNGALAGSGSADRIPGGPLAALHFLANSLVDRGSSLRPGDWVSTGASTGVHPVAVGDQVAVRFDGKPAITLQVCEAVPA